MAEEPVLDDATLDGLRDLGGDDFVAELAQLFLQDSPQHVESIAAARTSGDAADLARAAHALKSAAANMGAKALQAILMDLERDGRAGSVNHAAVDAMQSEYARVVRAMEALRG